MKQAEPIWTRDFIMVVLINLFIFVYFYALLTVLPVYAMQELGGSESEGGLLISGFMLSAIFARPFSGAVIERFGKREWHSSASCCLLWHHFFISSFTISTCCLAFAFSKAFGSASSPR